MKSTKNKILILFFMIGIFNLNYSTVTIQNQTPYSIKLEYLFESFGKRKWATVGPLKPKSVGEYLYPTTFSDVDLPTDKKIVYNLFSNFEKKTYMGNYRQVLAQTGGNIGNKFIKVFYENGKFGMKIQ